MNRRFKTTKQSLPWLHCRVHLLLQMFFFYIAAWKTVPNFSLTETKPSHEQQHKQIRSGSDTKKITKNFAQGMDFYFSKKNE